MKTCTKCNEEKPLDEYYSRSGRDTKFNHCKTCHYHMNRARRCPDKVREYQWKYNYGITRADYDRMLAEQGGTCRTCDADDRLVVDHCHTTGVVRGILCDDCNVSLGKLKDNPKTLQNLIDYLNRGTETPAIH